MSGRSSEPYSTNSCLDLALASQRPNCDAATLARAPEIKGDLLLIFGTRDPHTPETGRQVVRRGVRDNNVTWLEYDAEHAFGRDIGPRYDPEITDEAFAQTVAHLRRTLA
jgi:carboxymethylenebutenolidase